MRSVVSGLIALLLLATGAVVAPGLAPSLGSPEPPDTRLAGAREREAEFLADRNVLRIEIREDTTVAEFLRAEHLAGTDAKRQLARAKGVPLAAVGRERLAAGESFEIRLTPPREQH